MSWLTLPCVLAVGVTIAGIAAGCGSDERDAPWNRLGPRDHRFEREARAFSDYPIYWLGTGFEGLPLTGADRFEEEVWHGSYRTTPATRAVDEFGFVYGPCSTPWDPPPDADHSCPLPDVQVSTTALCAKGPKTLGMSPARLRRHPSGALVAARGGVVTVFTGNAVVSVSAPDDRRALRALRALRPINRSGRPGRLIAPVRAGLTGKLPCGALSHPYG